MGTTEQVVGVCPRRGMEGPFIPCDVATLHGRTLSVYDGTTGKRMLQRAIEPQRLGEYTRALTAPVAFKRLFNAVVIDPELLAFLRAHGEPMAMLEGRVVVDDRERVVLYSDLGADVVRAVVEGALLGNARVSLARAQVPVGVARAEVADRARAARLARWGVAIGSELAPTFAALEILAVAESTEGEMVRAMHGRTVREAERVLALVAREKATVQAIRHAVGAWNTWDAFGPDIVPPTPAARPAT